jgi:hypothetical protein
MGYGYYTVGCIGYGRDEAISRPAGYMVRATCDRRGCDAVINRGLGYPWCVPHLGKAKRLDPDALNMECHPHDHVDPQPHDFPPAPSASGDLRAIELADELAEAVLGYKSGHQTTAIADRYVAHRRAALSAEGAESR